MAEVVVTGGAGFIGSRLVRHLVKSGQQVLVVDNLHSGSVGNLKDVEVAFAQYDSSHVEPACLAVGMDEPAVIFHLGMPSASRYYRDDPMLMVDAVGSSIAVFEFASRVGARVVATSTSSVYWGHPTPHREDLVPKVAGLYTEGRIAVERLAEYYHRTKGLEVSVLRPFSVYGKGGECKRNGANIVNRMVLAALGRDSPPIYGDGSATRDFVDVDDVCLAFLKASVSGRSGVYNVGTGDSWSLSELHELVWKAAGKEFGLPHVEAPATFPHDTQADTAKAEDELGFVALKPLPDGVQDLLGYYGLLKSPEAV